jgi:hypothetical protein
MRVARANAPDRASRKQAQQKPQPGEDGAEIVADGSQDNVDCITLTPFLSSPASSVAPSLAIAIAKHAVDLIPAADA